MSSTRTPTIRWCASPTPGPVTCFTAARMTTARWVLRQARKPFRRSSTFLREWKRAPVSSKSSRMAFHQVRSALRFSRSQCAVLPCEAGEDSDSQARERAVQGTLRTAAQLGHEFEDRAAAQIVVAAVHAIHRGGAIEGALLVDEARLGIALVAFPREFVEHCLPASGRIHLEDRAAAFAAARAAGITAAPQRRAIEHVVYNDESRHRRGAVASAGETVDHRLRAGQRIDLEHGAATVRSAAVGGGAVEHPLIRDEASGRIGPIGTRELVQERFDPRLRRKGVNRTEILSLAGCGPIERVVETEHARFWKFFDGVTCEAVQIGAD